MRQACIKYPPHPLAQETQQLFPCSSAKPYQAPASYKRPGHLPLETSRNELVRRHSLPAVYTGRLEDGYIAGCAADGLPRLTAAERVQDLGARTTAPLDAGRSVQVDNQK